MLTSLALVFLLGLAAAALCSRIGLPRIIGMLLAGILIGPYVLNWLDDSILSISSELRQMALIIILIKAGLSLDLSDLRQVGRPAVLLSCLRPASLPGMSCLRHTCSASAASRPPLWAQFSRRFRLRSLYRAWFR